MSQRIRRSLAVGLLAAFSLAIPVPSQAAGLWDTAAPSVWMAQAWSWLESLGLLPQPTPSRPAAQREKSGSGLAAPGGTSTVTEAPPPGGPGGGVYQGSGIDPNGVK